MTSCHPEHREPHPVLSMNAFAASAPSWVGKRDMVLPPWQKDTQAYGPVPSSHSAFRAISLVTFRIVKTFVIECHELSLSVRETDSICLYWKERQTFAHCLVR